MASWRTRSFILFFLLSLGIAPVVIGHTQSLVFPVVPYDLASVEGNTNNGYPFNIRPLNVNSMRYQQVFDAAQFRNLRGPHQIITLVFRPDQTQGGRFLEAIDDIQINLSITSRTSLNLSTVFAENVGANDQVVFPRGPLHLSSSFLGPPFGAKFFDIFIPLSAPFVYDPARGNLLMDVRTYRTQAVITQLDAHRANNDGVARVFSTDVNLSVGRGDTVGLVTQFRAEPLATIGGRVVLYGTPDAQGQQVQFTFRPRGGGNPITRLITLGANGQFEIEMLPRATYDIAVEGRKWLRRVVTNVNPVDGVLTGLVVTLRPGDLNRDNIVDLFDMIQFFEAYGANANPPDPNWNELADITGDGVVDLFDLLLFFENYGAIGDP
jgi:hypothetical protein